MDISHRQFVFNVVLPKDMSEASIAGARKFCDEAGVTEFELKTSTRHYPFYVRSVLKSGKMEFFDYPTTLRASHECVTMVYPRTSTGPGRFMSMLDEREIQNFANALQRLMADDSDSAEFRDNIKLEWRGHPQLGI